MLPPSKRARLETYEAVSLLDKHDENWIADLEQNYPHACITQGVPTLTRVFSPWSSTKERIALGREHLLMQGVPSYPDQVSAPYACPFLKVIPDLSEATLKSLAGNAFHMPTASIILGFVIANVRTPACRRR